MENNMNIKISRKEKKLIKKICKDNDIEICLRNQKNDEDFMGYNMYFSSFIPELNLINLNEYEIKKMYAKNKALLNKEGYYEDNVFFGTFLHELGHYKTIKKYGEEKMASFYFRWYEGDIEGQEDYDNLYPEKLANRYFRRYYKDYMKGLEKQ
jgi:hypothetical protein